MKTLKGHSPDNEECTCKFFAGEDEFSGEDEDEYEADLNCPVQGHSSAVTCVQFNPRVEGQLVSGSTDKTIKVWNVSDGKCLQTLTGHSSGVCCVQFNPRDAEQLVSGSLDRTVKLWSVADGKCERTFTGHSYGVRTVAWRFDGKLLASGGGGDKIILWDPKKGERLKTLEGNNELVSASEFAPHGKTIMVASRDGTLKIRDVESGT